MIALACIILVLSGVVLMISQGVGPFAREPWEAYYFRFRKIPNGMQKVIILIASIVAIVSTCIVIGIIPVETQLQPTLK